MLGFVFVEFVGKKHEKNLLCGDRSRNGMTRINKWRSGPTKESKLKKEKSQKRRNKGKKED